MTTIAQNAATPGQIKSLNRLVSDAAEKAISDFGPDNPGAQRVIMHGDEFAEAVRTAVIASLKDLSVSDKYKNEEVLSNFGYLSGYKPGMEDIDRQITVLQGLFPGLGGANPEYMAKVKSGAVPLPKGAEKFFAIPNWQKHPEIFETTYAQAVLAVLAKIKETHNGKFVNYRNGQIDDQHLRLTARTEKALRELAEAQGNPDILLIPSQFGKLHAGQSVRRAIEVMPANEFGLDPFTVGIMLLTHTERLKHFDDLWIDCSGAEFDDPGSAQRFGRAPSFVFSDDGIEFGTRFVGHPDSYYGSVSGFSPQ